MNDFQVKPEKFKDTQSSTLLDYYRNNNINPVPIQLTDPDEWKVHLEKRRNLYERHLGIPLHFFKDRRVIEIGCNSGENALVLANYGAKLTLVEPNDKVLPRLHQLFEHFGFQNQIEELIEEDINAFRTETEYDVVIAEGFLNHLPNYKEIIGKLCQLISPGGIGIISQDDRYGYLLEMLRKLIFCRVCWLAKTEEPPSEASIKIAKTLFGEEFSKLNSSRPFEAWYLDNLVNPFTGWKFLSTFQELIAILNQNQCEFKASSPQWAPVDFYAWYKNVPNVRDRHNQILRSWKSNFAYFLFGITPKGLASPVDDKIVNAVSEFILQSSNYCIDPDSSIDAVVYSQAIQEYLNQLDDSRFQNRNKEIETICEAMKTCTNAEKLIHIYHEQTGIRDLWGAPCQYYSFIKCY